MRARCLFSALSILAGLAMAGGPFAQASQDDAVHQSEKASFRLVPLARGLEHPWGMAELPDGRFLVTERPGRLRLVDPRDGHLSAPLAGVPRVAARGQGGLLDVALDPAFAETGWVYLSHSVDLGTGLTTRVSRHAWNGTGLGAGEVIFTAGPPGNKSHHFGSRLAFDGEGYLFLTIGDRGERTRARDPANDGGKVHRIHADGSIPKDNPFAGVPGASPSVWSLGHRNPQGLAVDGETGLLWETEHGPRGGDEVNVIDPGVDYGWPTITYGREYSGFQVGDGLTEAPGLAQPIIHWTPSIAPSGLAVYRGEAFPEWSGNLFAGGLALTQLRRLEVDGRRIIHQEVLLEDEIGRIRDVHAGSDGGLYLLTDAEDGVLYRLDPI